jgi:hypothetical protein
MIRQVSRYVQARAASPPYFVNSTNRTEEFTNDRQMQMQSMQMRARVPLRRRTRRVQLRPVVQVRELHLREVTVVRRRDIPFGQRAPPHPHVIAIPEHPLGGPASARPSTWRRRRFSRCVSACAANCG